MSRQLPKAVKRQILEPKIPKGWETYTAPFTVMGLDYDLDSARTGLDGNKSLIAKVKVESVFGEDPYLRVIITKKMRFIGFLGFRDRFNAGYVPVHICEVIFKHGLQDVVRARIRRSYIHADKTVSIFIDLVGPEKLFTDEVNDDLGLACLTLSVFDDEGE